MEIVVLLSLSVRPFDVGWCGIVRVFTISTISQIALNVLLANNDLIFICWYMITSLPCLAHCNFGRSVIEKYLCVLKFSFITFKH